MTQPYLNRSLSPQERALDLVGRMTVEEKIGQMMQISYKCVGNEEASEWVSKRFIGSLLYIFGSESNDMQQLASQTRLGIPLLFGIDAIHGHALKNGATVFPSQLAMSCSWNSELIEQSARVTAREVVADGLHWTFSPVLCVGRDLRWGRINETFGEDPYLVGVFASAMIRGYQGKNLSDSDSILACAKHYIAYGESTGGRDSYDTQITMRKLREVFLPPFKNAVDAGCTTVMSSYQSIDGIPVSSNSKIIRNILKNELGFNGFVVTDWNNTGNLYTKQKTSQDIHDASKRIVEAGNDMIMTTPEFYESAIELVKKRVIPEKLIDEAVKRILCIKFALGLFDDKKNIDPSSKTNIYACQEHLDVNIKLTRECMVLLENRNHTLPLGDNVKKIAVIGPNADDISAQFGDWTYYNQLNASPDIMPQAPFATILGGIRKLSLEKGIEVVYHKGCHIMNKNEEDIQSAVKCAQEADIVVAVLGDCLAQTGETKDRADLNLSGLQQQLLESLKATEKKLVVVLVNGKPLSIPWITQNADAVVETFNSGMLGGIALAELLFGKINPCGKLTISFPYHSGQLPVYYNQLPGWHGDKYMDMPQSPLYSFGYGLSYSNFKYSNLRLSKSRCSKDDVVSVSVDIANDSQYDGIEIAQLYVNDIHRSIMAPIKELKGFKREFIKAGETKTFEFFLQINELGFINHEEKYIIEPGEFIIMVGTDSRDEVLLKNSIIVE